MKNVRIQDNCYTLGVNVQAGDPVSASVPIYFTGYPVLRNKKIKRIATSFPSALALFPGPLLTTYLTLVTGNKERLIVNQPISDLLIAPIFVNNPRARYYDVYDIDLQNSYYTIQATGTWGTSFQLFALHFYY